MWENPIIHHRLLQRRHLGGLGGLRPPPKKKKRKKLKKKKEKKKKEKEKRKKEKKRKKGIMNSGKLLHIKCCFSNFSIVRQHWKIKKNVGPQEKVEMTPLDCYFPTLAHFTDLMRICTRHLASCSEMASDNFQQLKALQFQHHFQPLSILSYLILSYLVSQYNIQTWLVFV